MNQDTIQRTDPYADPAQRGAAAPAKTTFQGSGASSGIEEVKKVARAQAHDTTAEIKGGASQAFESAKDTGTDFIEDQKCKLACLIDEYTHAVKAACDSLESEDQNRLVGPAHRASRQMERASEYLRATDPVDILHDLGDYAKRKPELLFGAMFVAGMASVRFLKASARDRGSRSGSAGTALAKSNYDSPRREPFSAPAPVGPTPAHQTNTPPVLP